MPVPSDRVVGLERRISPAFLWPGPRMAKADSRERFGLGRWRRFLSFRSFQKYPQDTRAIGRTCYRGDNAWSARSGVLQQRDGPALRSNSKRREIRLLR